MTSAAAVARDGRQAGGAKRVRRLRRPRYVYGTTWLTWAEQSGTPTHSGSQTVWPAAPESEARQLLDAWVEGGERGWEGLELFA
ncbi:hypothetical protein ACIOMM_32830 [Streptomyces sp. NPDC087908]|uniref:hypothetical protein n=1 Tax=Streptomyces sp. NPDC087908 TaxID=3365820 RepID=UPI0037FB18D9